MCTFQMVKVSDTRVAFKTAYGRYISSVPDSGDVVAQTEAMGVREMYALPNVVVLQYHLVTTCFCVS